MIYGCKPKPTLRIYEEAGNPHKYCKNTGRVDFSNLGNLKYELILLF